MNIENIKRANEIANRLSNIVTQLNAIKKNEDRDGTDIRICHHNGYSTSTISSSNDKELIATVKILLIAKLEKERDALIEESKSL
jgi:hypothetical protein